MFEVVRKEKFRSGTDDDDDDEKIFSPMMSTSTAFLHHD